MSEGLRDTFHWMGMWKSEDNLEVLKGSVGPVLVSESRTRSHWHLPSYKTTVHMNVSGMRWSDFELREGVQQNTL